MKLIGSKTESDARAQLLRTREALFHDQAYSQLMAALRHAHAELQTAYVLKWTPEQGEDIYLVLVDNDHLLRVEIDRHAGTTVNTQRLDVSAYERASSRANRIHPCNCQRVEHA